MGPHTCACGRQVMIGLAVVVAGTVTFSNGTHSQASLAGTVRNAPVVTAADTALAESRHARFSRARDPAGQLCSRTQMPVEMTSPSTTATRTGPTAPAVVAAAALTPLIWFDGVEAVRSV